MHVTGELGGKQCDVIVCQMLKFVFSLCIWMFHWIPWHCPCLPHNTVATTSIFLWWSTLSSFLKQIFYSNSIKQSFCFEVNWIEGNNHNILLSDILFKEVLMLLFNSQFDCFIKQLSLLIIFPHQLTFFINQLSMSINLFDF